MKNTTEVVDVKPQTLDERLEGLQYWYAQTGNALFIWETIRECLKAGADLPKWTHIYLYAVSCSLGDPEANPGAKAGDYVLAALHLKSSSGPGRFSQRRSLHRKWAHVGRAALKAELDVLNDGAVSFEKKYEDHLADSGVSTEAVQKQFSRLGRPWDKT